MRDRVDRGRYTIYVSNLELDGWKGARFSARKMAYHFHECGWVCVYAHIHIHVLWVVHTLDCQNQFGIISFPECNIYGATFGLCCY